MELNPGYSFVDEDGLPEITRNKEYYNKNPKEQYPNCKELVYIDKARSLPNSSLATGVFLGTVIFNSIFLTQNQYLSLWFMFAIVTMIGWMVICVVITGTVNMVVGLLTILVNQEYQVEEIDFYDQSFYLIALPINILLTLQFLGFIF